MHRCTIESMRAPLVRLLALAAPVIAAACAAPTPAEHDATLAAFLLNFGDVQTVDEVIAALGRDPGPG
jgi:hypothetical protein